MRVVGASEAKTHFSVLLKRVEVAQSTMRETIEKIKVLGKKHTLGSLSWKELRDEGRCNAAGEGK